MQLAFTDDQLELGRSVRKFLAVRSDEPEVRRLMDDAIGYDPAVWQEFSRQDLIGLAIPEHLGGAGGGALEQVVVFEELGRSLTCLPYFAPVALAANLVLAADDPEAQQRYLPPIARGESIATVALLESSAKWDEGSVCTRADDSGDGFTLQGEKLYVLDGHVADVIFVVARTATGTSLFGVDRHGALGLTVEPMATIDLARKQARIVFDRTPAVLVGRAGEGWP